METYKSNLAAESAEFKMIKTRAQANEFLYYKLKEIGLVTQIDENIGVELLDLERIFSQQGFYENQSIATSVVIS